MRHKRLSDLKHQALLQLLIDICEPLLVQHEYVMSGENRLRALSDARTIFVHYAYQLEYQSRDMCLFLGCNHASVAYHNSQYDNLVDTLFEHKKLLVEKHLNNDPLVSK